MRKTVLSFVFDGDRVLMILKKRGMGEGKWNFPGGKIQAHESALETVLRETREETGLTPVEPRHVGTLEFYFPEGAKSWSNICEVYRAEAFHGALILDTEECSNAWVDVARIPYDKMWADDVRWVPLLLAGKSFRRVYRFNSANELSSEEIKD